MNQPIPIPGDAICTMTPSEWPAWWRANPDGTGPLPQNKLPTNAWQPKRLNFSVPPAMLERELRMSVKPPDVKSSDWVATPLSPDWLDAHQITCVVENDSGLKHTALMSFQLEQDGGIRFKTEGFSIDAFLAKSRTIALKVVIPPTYSRQTVFQSSGWLEAAHAAHKVDFGGDFSYLIDRTRQDAIFFFVRASFFKLVAWQHDREIDRLALVSSQSKRAVYTGSLKA